MPQTQFIMVTKREKLDILLKKKRLMEVLCVIVYLCCGVEREQAQRSLKMQQARAV